MKTNKEVKKRHRRTKAELLQDPEYCRKHGLKPPKPAKPEKPSKKRKATKVQTPEEPKKRHRRTKAELLQDQEYCRKHGIEPAASAVNKQEKAATKEAARPKKATKADRVAELELKYLPKLYAAWQKVQALMNELDKTLNLRAQPKELMHFDFACTRMEQAFDQLEDEIKNRETK